MSESRSPRLGLPQLAKHDFVIFAGLFLFVLSVYCLTGPGRIDTIDGQSRYEVTRSLLDGFGFQVRDPLLRTAPVGIDGRRYSEYGPAASLLALPLCFIGRLVSGTRNADMFFFSLASALVSSFCVGLFYFFRRRLGGSVRSALLWSLALAFTTPLWPLAASVFHQAQQGTVILLSLFLAWEGAKRGRPSYVFWSGVVGGSLVLFQMALVVLVPCLGLAALEGFDRRVWKEKSSATAALTRYAPFVGGCLLPFAAVLVFNQMRFGHPLNAGPSSQPGHPPVLGNPLLGAAGLLVSPGKSIFLFFPPLVLTFFYLRRCFRRCPALCVSLSTVVVAMFALNASLSMWPSDWAWGPRYVMLLAPILTLPMGMQGDGVVPQRSLRNLLLVLGGCVQLLGVSVEHIRFFFERRLPTFFWYADPLFYFKESQWFARIFEVISLVEEGIPTTARVFCPGPFPVELPTYSLFAGPPQTSDVWMRLYTVFYLPRPWPFWVPTLDVGSQPVDPVWASVMLVCIGVLGVLLVLVGASVCRRVER